jgi:HlyD family type I secretion membrane fusion protein
MNAMAPITPADALADELAAAPTRLLRTLGIACGIALLLILGWAALVPIASGAVAPGEIIVENSRKTIQHLDGGIVRRIAVREGTKVRQGDLLIQLDDTDTRLNVSVLQSQADSLRAEQAARQAELMGKAEIIFPADLIARTSDPDVSAAIAAQEAAFIARRSNVAGRKSQLGEKMVQYGQEIRGANAQSDSTADQIKLLEGEIDDVQKLFDRGLATKARLLALQRARAQLIGQRQALNSESAKLRAQTRVALL